MVPRARPTLLLSTLSLLMLLGLLFLRENPFYSSLYHGHLDAKWKTIEVKEIGAQRNKAKLKTSKIKSLT